MDQRFVPSAESVPSSPVGGCHIRISGDGHEDTAARNFTIRLFRFDNFLKLNFLEFLKKHSDIREICKKKTHHTIEFNSMVKRCKSVTVVNGCSLIDLIVTLLL